MATYPSEILVKADVINEVDVYDQSDHNILKDEIISLQSTIGTNPHGDRANLAARLNAMSNPSGFLISSTGVPQPTAPGFLWRDSTSEVLKYIKSDGTPQTVGQNFSNVIFDDGVSTGSGPFTMFVGGTLLPTQPPTQYLFWVQTISTTFTKVRPSFKWKKISGVNTLKCIAYRWAPSGSEWAQFAFGIGATTTAGATTTSTAPVMETLSLGISGLANGTVYDIDFTMRRQTSPGVVYCGQVIITGE